jgi:Cu/Ag efflux protein CusF
MNTKTRFVTLFTILVFACSRAASGADDLGKSVQTGLFEEEANHNLTAAIKAYEAALGQFDGQRQAAATAVFRIGECYRKLGKTNEAAPFYERIVREFGDQTNLVQLSRQFVLSKPGLPGRVLFVGPTLRGPVAIPPGKTEYVSEAILELPADPDADLSKVEVQRYDPETKKVTVIHLDMDAILYQGLRQNDIVLIDNDRIMVPLKPRIRTVSQQEVPSAPPVAGKTPAASSPAPPAPTGRVLFVGPTLRGPVMIPPGTTRYLSEAVLELPEDKYANLRKVVVERYDPETKKVTKILVDVQGILHEGLRQNDIVLHDGDRITVPEKFFLVN